MRKRTDVGVSRPGSLLVFQFIPRALDEIEVRALFQTSSCSSTLNWTISSFVHRFTVSLIEMKGFPKLPPKWRHTVAAVLWPVYLMSQNIACCWIDQTYPKELGLQVMKLQMKFRYMFSFSQWEKSLHWPVMIVEERPPHCRLQLYCQALIDLYWIWSTAYTLPKLEVNPQRHL